MFSQHVDLPGVDVESSDVTQEENTLAGHPRRAPLAPADAVDLIDERPVGSHARRLVVGDGLSLDAIVAEYHDGVLTVTIRVAETARPRQVVVERRGVADLTVAVANPAAAAVQAGALIGATT